MYSSWDYRQDRLSGWPEAVGHDMTDDRPTRRGADVLPPIESTRGFVSARSEKYRPTRI